MATLHRSASGVLEGEAGSASQSQSNVGVIEVFRAGLGDTDLPVAVAAIASLTHCIEHSQASTMMALHIELKEAVQAIQNFAAHTSTRTVPLKAACDLFMRYVTRTTGSGTELERVKALLVLRGHAFAQTSVKARARIAELGERFLESGGAVLVHGRSRVVLALLRAAAASGTQFTAFVTEGRPDDSGVAMARALDSYGIPVTMVLDSAVAHVMDKVSFVLVGAEAVVESGGILSKMGTYQVATVAKALGRPFYVAVESFKFARFFPVNNHDLPIAPRPVDYAAPLPAGVDTDMPPTDYTPPTCIDLLFTDLGILTPSAVSDELVRLYMS